MNKISTKRAMPHIPLCAGIVGVAGIFIFFGLGSFVAVVAVIAAIVFLLNLVLRWLGAMTSRKFNVKAWVGRTCAALLAVMNIFIAICGLTYAVQDTLIFHNVADFESREFLQEIAGYSEIAFTAENGKTYHGMMYTASDEKAPLVIYFGGNGEVSHRHMRNREEREEWQYFDGFHYLFVDYEGYGLNDGSAHYQSMYEQALAVFDYAATLPNVDSGRIVAMGYSLGTGSAVYLAANRPVAGSILATPYANGYDLYNAMLPIFHGPMKLLVKQKLPSDEYAPEVSCPALIIASRNDEAIPFASTERLAALFPGEVDFIKLDNVYHNEVFGADGVFDRVQSFLEGVAS